MYTPMIAPGDLVVWEQDCWTMAELEKLHEEWGERPDFGPTLGKLHESVTESVANEVWELK